MDKKLINQKVKICFVSLNSYHLMIERNSSYAGGAEVQQIEIAKELKKRGYEISFITYGDKNNNMETKNIHGFNILFGYNRSQVDQLGFFRKALCIWKKMKEADADIYYHSAGSSGIATLFCRLNKKKIIIRISSDADVTGEDILTANIAVNLLNKISKWIDIKLSDIIISQNGFQKSELKKRFNIESIIIKNCFNTVLNLNKKFYDYILWIGMIRSVKQPELFLNIAQYFPEYKFVMIGGVAEDLDLFNKIKNAARKIENVEFKDFVPHQNIYAYYPKAILVVSTSKTEGFPNIFLEAWSFSTPVVSLNVDPDGIISKYKLGYCSGNFNQMLNDIKTLLKDRELLKSMAENGRKYVELNHDIRKTVDQYENLITNLINPKENVN
jgi:glycosyltransferase involved in cell wall biosynthesis